jgi:RHS repeat-associated protein
LCNVSIIYHYDRKTAQLRWSEQHLYGSARLGMYLPEKSVTSVSTDSKQREVGYLGKQVFELSNHLGNVLATITDKKLQVSTNTTSTDYFEADVQTVQDYYAFGMQMPGRKLSGGYRYGFNGKENDNEVKGEGNQQDYGMRIYDPRLGKFLSTDPLAKKYPELTPYQFASNRPIDGIDMDGLEYSPAGWGPNGPRESTSVKLVPLHPVVMHEINKQVQARNEVVNRYNNEIILKADIFGNGHIGRREYVQDEVRIINRDYYNAVGENIAGGPFGAAGYYLNREKGSFAGAALDQIAFSFGGVPGEGFLSKSKITPQSNLRGSNEDLAAKYAKNRPAFRQSTINNVWEAAKDVNGKVFDPNTFEELTWDKFKSRYDQWHMGHKPGHEYRSLIDQLKNGKINNEQFLSEYNNPKNYAPEAPAANMSHKYEAPKTGSN